MTEKTLQKILYVDDEEDIRMIVSLALEDVCGYTIRLCASGQQAMTEAVDFAPDLILLDVMMPGMDGPTTLNKLREQERLAQIPVIFMTAKAQTHEIERFKSLGVVDVITKPFDPMTLGGEVQAIWEKL